MYISYNWLKDFVKLPTKITAQEIADRLTAHTVEVEGYFDQASKYDKVVVGRVLSAEKHPNADRLKVTQVDVKNEKLQIVCGAPNVAAGQLVPVALVGANLPIGIEIKKSNIRGEDSSGMICAEDELGLGDDHDGIIVLDKKAKIGQPLSEYLKADDIIFEVDNKSLSNRPDLLSHYGLARELSVIFDSKLITYDKIIGKKEELSKINNNKLEVEVLAKEACPRYMAVRIDNIKIEDSPDWLKNRLVAVNQRPINNIVDLTNYVMLESGQPLHAFDANKIKKITIRLANKEETITTLDGKERLLSNDDLVIASSKEPIALAGIIGGKNSEIDDNSTSIILEVANFRADIIRRTAQRLNLRTEASTRFEKSLDPNLTEEALYRFIALLKQIQPSIKVANYLVDLGGGTNILKPIYIDLNWLSEKIGQDIPKDKVLSYLNHLGFKVIKHKDQLELEVPSWRSTKDIKSKEDIVEEILRMYGYDNIKSSLPLERLRAVEVNQERKMEREIKDILSLNFSLTETYNYSFVGEDQLKKLNIDFFKHLKLANPLSEIHSMLRQSLVPGLVGNIKTNQAKDDALGFFEIGNTFFNAPGSLIKDKESQDHLPYQEKKIGIAIAANRRDLFLELKGMISCLIKKVIDNEVKVSFSHFENIPGWANNEVCAKISIGEVELGIIAMLGAGPSKNLNIKLKACLSEINMSALFLLKARSGDRIFKEAPKFPPAIRDLSFVVSDRILYNDIKEAILGVSNLIKEVELFDVYSGDKLDKGEKSLAFRFTYQSPDHTLTSKEVDDLQKDIVDKIVNKFEARLRDF